MAADLPVTTQVGRNSHARRQWFWWSIAALALTVGLVSFVGLLPTKDPTVVVLTKAPVNTTTVKVATFPVVPHSRPVKLTIPAIGVTSYVGRLGLQKNGQVQVPTSTHIVGWYIDGPTPGQVGSAVILGHVDSYLGPGTFFNLKLLKAGNTISLVLADGAVTRFAVTKVVQYSKTGFPDRLVYGSNGTRSLQLVTCGGTFNRATGSYESNVVVFSHLLSVTLPKR